MHPNKPKGLEVFMDASFSEDRNCSFSKNVLLVLSRTGFAVKYMNCPLLWISKLQTEIVLSIIEAEYIVLLHVIQETLLLLKLIKEMYQAIGIEEYILEYNIKCTVLEDNNRYIKLAKCLKLCLYTKYIRIKYYHFRSKVVDGTIRVLLINTKE